MSRPADKVTGGYSAYALVTRDDVADIAREINPTAAVVWVVLLTYADRQGGSVFPMQSTITRATGLPGRTIRRALEALDREGWISRRWKITPYGKRREYEVHVRAAIKASTTPRP